MTTRREIVKAGAGLAAIIAAGRAPASLVRSMLGARGASFAARRKPKLPYDAEVEYLESTGTQYIDTGYRMTADNLRFEADMMQKPSGNPADFFFGYRFTSQATSVGDMRAFFVFGTGAASDINIGQVAIRYGAGSDRTYAQGRLTMSQRGTVGYSSPNLVVNGVATSVSTAASANPSYGSMYLFWCNTTGYYSSDVTKFVGRIYSFKMWQGDVLVRDYIPVRIGTEGAMYDRVNGTLFRNAGTGAFLTNEDAA